ncbi:MAG: ABC transporter ATP-binding protein [Oscillospiraceae bacterium]|nr:ABC transporter ATP-binding protein [Oscillospiraceae bacterium]
MEPIVSVRNAKIRYKVGNFRDIGLKEWVLSKIRGKYHVGYFMAVDDVSFDLYEGEMLGIIGTNGAGKSTLLKALSGIMEPSEGTVFRRGNIAALLELGSGFDDDLTVKENTYLRGAILGYSRKLIDEVYNDIIDFAELSEFADRPFKQLSSGMKSRLAFSIASMVSPDILVLDEVLSVGDGSFQKKSEERMRSIISANATTILVSHSLAQIRSMCTKILWLHKGKQVTVGTDVQHICDLYEDFLNGRITQEEILSGKLFNE